ncbi:hypothetical protein RJT34_08398 [Clitoria ternatea]|uniref:GATA-type domain-containing protein n=1 Tax=Clitoria ternatea TaxID=43366 RepID=A0AAN9K6Z4_CLITE
MTPISLNPPGPNSIQAASQTQLFISPNNEDYCTFFNILDSRQTIEIGNFRETYQQDDKIVMHDGSSSSNCNIQSFISPEKVMVMEDGSRRACEGDLTSYKMEEEDGKNGHGSPKWMPSKMRLMKKMMSPGTTDKATMNNNPCRPRLIQNHHQGHESKYCQRSPRNNNSISTTTRVCSDCNTSTTPLWRSGPNGPKSLCNACGIRQRKARRAMLEAANGLGSNATATKTRVHNKDKKSRTNNFAQFKNKYKSTTTTTSSEGVKKLEYFKDLSISLRNNSALQQVFPRDEVAEAALLLMDLSCGFLHL